MAMCELLAAVRMLASKALGTARVAVEGELLYCLTCFPTRTVRYGWTSVLRRSYTVCSVDTLSKE